MRLYLFSLWNIVLILLFTIFFVTYIKSKASLIMKFKLPSIFPAPPPAIEEESRIQDASSSTEEVCKKGGENDITDDSPEFQHGVQGVQASSQIWTKNQLILAYVL